MFRERSRLAISFRHVPLNVPTIDELNLPRVIAEIAQTERGLVLVTCTTGSGKSTTLAAMIDFLNKNRRHRIITIEDPIEFLHDSENSLIAQRESGLDAVGLASSLREALRQDLDFIFVGELGDLETMRTAI